MTAHGPFGTLTTQERWALLLAVLAAVIGTAGAVASLLNGQMPMVGLIVALISGRVALRLWAQRRATPESDSVNGAADSSNASKEGAD